MHTLVSLNNEKRDFKLLASVKQGEPLDLRIRTKKGENDERRSLRKYGIEYIEDNGLDGVKLGVKIGKIDGDVFHPGAETTSAGSGYEIQRTGFVEYNTTTGIKVRVTPIFREK